ncbi:13520_t:CDS:2, partial [Funneliformis caledonium]
MELGLGRFSFIETEVEEQKIKLIKDLQKSSLSIVLVGTASDNPEINYDKITLNLNAREYIDNTHNKFLVFNLYHFPNDNHLLSITTKVLRGSSLYITGYLSIIEKLLLVRLTQINFIENTRPLPHKSSSYAWEKNQTNESFTNSTPSATDIAKSLLEKTNKKRVRNQASTSSNTLKIPKLSSLALSQPKEDQEEEDTLISIQPNTINDSQDE